MRTSFCYRVTVPDWITASKCKEAHRPLLLDDILQRHKGGVQHRACIRRHRVCMHENATPDMFRAVYELWPDAINEKDKPQDHYRTGKPLHYFCKEGQMSSQTATELIKIVGARVAFKKRGTCKHILLHYACQSKESTQDLFEYFTKKQRQEAEHFYEEEEFVFKNELIDARALAEFLRLPASSLERVASQQLMIEKVNTKVVDRDNMLMLHFEGVAIVV